jgi:hypothetical protein
MDGFEPYETETYSDEMDRIVGALSREYSPEAWELVQRLTDGDRYDEPQDVSVEEELEETGSVTLPGENGKVVIRDGYSVSARYSPDGQSPVTEFETEVDSSFEVDVSAMELEVADKEAGAEFYGRDIH